AVLGGDGGDDGQAEAGADAGAGPVGLPEAVEGVGDGIVVEAGAVVADADVGVAVGEVGRHFHRRAGGRVGQGVGDEVGDGLAEVGFVAVDDDGLGGVEGDAAV